TSRTPRNCLCCLIVRPPQEPDSASFARVDNRQGQAHFAGIFRRGSKPMGYRVAVVGATGNVGREILNILAERQFPLDEVAALASARSTGDVIDFGDSGETL